LRRAIAARTARIGIIGPRLCRLAVGLPVCGEGVPTTGFDIDAPKITALNSGRSYIKHIPGKRIAAVRKGGTFDATDDFARLKQMDAIIICVPTPLTKYREPDLQFIVKTGQEIAPHLRQGPAGGAGIQHLSRHHARGAEADPGSDRPQVRQRFLARLLAGARGSRQRQLRHQRHPKVVGGDGKVALDLTVALYDQVVVKTVPVSSPETAETVKLTENIFRAVNIALVNELKVICAAMGIDVWEVIEAAKTKPFGFMPFYPGPASAGIASRSIPST
jgi:UDP-N-acetyl-D-glucosamine dehydrogenase